MSDPSTKRPRCKIGDEMRGIKLRLRNNEPVAWITDIVRGKIRAKRQFSFKKNGGSDNALAAAQSWRDAISMQLSTSLPVEQRLKVQTLLKAPNRALAAMKADAAAAGSTCLDKEWQGLRYWYHFVCNSGHEWRRNRNDHRRSPNCPLCRNDKIQKKKFNADKKALNKFDNAVDRYYKKHLPV